MGPGEGATDIDKKRAYELGQLIAEQDWFLLTGGRNAGVMEAACKGAKTAHGLTLGIIPSTNNDNTSEFVDISIITGMSSARNNINVLTADVIVACGMGKGTASEIALALKIGKKVILINDNDKAKAFFNDLDPENIRIAASSQDVIKIIKATPPLTKRNI